MNYYRRYSGDYLRDTARLTLTEHGAYTLLMDYYYADEKPLPLDHEELFLMVRAMRPEDRAAVEKILVLYFQKRVDGYHQKRIDHEIEVSKTARTNGKGGGRPRTTHVTGHETEPQTGTVTGKGTAGKTGDETGNPSESRAGEGGGSGHPPTSNLQPPTTTRQPPVSAAIAAVAKPERVSPPDCPHDQIIDLYHRVLPELPQVAKWTPTRKGYLQARWREDKRHQSLEYWERFFTFVKESDFLCGRAKPIPGKKPFLADLEWIVTQGNFVKILERRYHE